METTCKDAEGTLYKTSEERDRANFLMDIEKIVHSFDEDLTNEYPDNYSIVAGVLSTLLKTDQEISREYIQEIIDTCVDEIMFEY
jgi:hypothetical protein